MTRSNPYAFGLDKNEANFVALSPLSFIERTAGVYPDRTATIYGSRVQTWRDTYTQARRDRCSAVILFIGRLLVDRQSHALHPLHHLLLQLDLNVLLQRRQRCQLGVFEQGCLSHRAWWHRALL